MANHPDPSKHPEQPDDTNKNPPTPPTDVTSGGSADLHAAEPTPSDSFIDLGIPGGPADPFASGPPAESHEPSDLSIVEWAALVEEAPADPAASSVKFDRPSDQDWAAQAVNATKSEPVAPSRPETHHAVDMTDLFADPAEVMADATAHDRAPVEPPPAHEPPPYVPLLTDEESDEQDSLAADLEVVRQTFNLDELDSQKKLTPPPSGADATAPAHLTPEDEDVFEEVDLSNKPGGSGSFSSSGVDLKQLDSNSFEEMVDEIAAAAEEPKSSVDLGSAELPSVPKSLDEDDDVLDPLPSGRDLIAEAVESDPSMKQPLMEIVEEEEALEASEVVESDPGMKQPLLEIVEDEEVLEASEVVESSGGMQQPLMEIVEEVAAPAEEVSEVVAAEEPSSAVDLGAAAETQTLTRSEMDALLASQELGAAAEAPLRAEEQRDEPPEKPTGRKTVVAGRHPVRTTQMQGDEFEDEAIEVVEEVTAAEPTADPVAQDIVIDAAEMVDEQLVVEDVVSAAPESGEMIVENVTEDGAPVVTEEEAVEASATGEEVTLDAAGEYSEDVSEIILRSDHPTLDSSAHLEELAETGSGADSGLLLDKLRGKQQPADVDPEEVQLGVGAGADELEEEAAADETAAEQPEKPKKQRSGALAFVGGGLLGTLAGVGVCAALYFGGLVGHAAPAPTTAPTQPKTVAAAPVPFEAKAADLRHGNLDRAEQDGIEKIDEAQPDQLAARGEYRLLKYLNGQAKANAPVKVNKDDPLVKEAVADLTKASANADDKAAAATALFHLAQIDELAGDEPGALKAYQEGAKKYEADPKLKRPFDAAVNRLTSRGPAMPGVGRLLDPQQSPEQQAFVLALLLCLQAPLPADDAADEEAGFKFWEAVKLERARNYPAALKALAEARQLHDKRRFLNLRKGQNPLSDPTEEIFLRACDELKTYWTIQEKLSSGGYLTAQQPDPAKAVDAALTLVADTRLTLQKQVESNKKLEADKKQADTTISDLNKTLAEQKTANTALVTINTKLADQKKKVDAELVAAKTDSAKLSDALKAEKETVTKVQDQLTKAQVILKEKDPQGLIGKLQNELSDTKATLKERWEPKDMLSIWLPVLEKSPSKDVADKALLDAGRVLKDAQATPEQQAQAQALRGLDLRNQDKFTEAKSALEAAKKGLVPGSPWLKAVNAALREVSNPTATYLARFAALRDQGDYGAALAALTKTIDTLPAEQRGDLLAERSLLRLEALHAQQRGPLTADDLKAARDDAQRAAAAGSAQGFYAEGRLAEELGQWQAAIAAYRKAVDKTPPPLDAPGSRYRAALGRALLQAQGKTGAAKEQSPDENKTSRLPALDRTPDPRQAVAVLLTLALQAPLLPPAGKEEALKLADEILAAKPGTVPFDIRAQALVIKGLYSEALRTYAEGLKAQKKLPPDYADGLLRLIEENPALRRPESLRDHNPLNAEKHYGAGLRWYYEHNWANAEKEFLEAIRNDPNDARYFYFLGLSRLAQNNNDAQEDFTQGAKLELQERPSRAAVSAALERVQGLPREELNAVRRSITLPTGK